MFVSGFATDVWIQRETTLLGATGENALGCDGVALFVLNAEQGSRSSRQSAGYRIDFTKSVAGWTSLQLKFELTLATPLMELLRSLMSNADFYQTTDAEEFRTWEPELSDAIHGLKVWLKDQYTGEGYLCEGCAVSEVEIVSQSRQITSITFGLLCLKATPMPKLSTPPVLVFDQVERPIITPDNCGVYFGQGMTVDDVIAGTAMPEILGTTQATVRIARKLVPAQIKRGSATRYSKTPAEFTGSIACRVTSTLRSWLALQDVYGAARFVFAQPDGDHLWATLPQVGLTFGESQLHSSIDTPTVTISMQAIQTPSTLNQAYASANLSLSRKAEAVYDAGEFNDTDINRNGGFDGGGPDITTSTIDAGSFP